MGTLKPGRTELDYDEDADVLYVTFGRPRKAETLDLGSGVLARCDKGSGELVGFTISGLNAITGRPASSKTAELGTVVLAALRERLSEELMFKVADELLKNSEISDELALKWGAQLKEAASRRHRRTGG